MNKYFNVSIVVLSDNRIYMEDFIIKNSFVDCFTFLKNKLTRKKLTGIYNLCVYDGNIRESQILNLSKSK